VYLEMLYAKLPLFYEDDPTKKRLTLYSLVWELSVPESPYSELPKETKNFLRVCLTVDCRMRPCLYDMMQRTEAKVFFSSL
jgi:serine/threonine protein kinase